MIVMQRRARPRADMCINGSILHHGWKPLRTEGVTVVYRNHAQRILTALAVGRASISLPAIINSVHNIKPFLDRPVTKY